MTKGKKLVFWSASFVILLGVVAALALFYFPHRKPLRIEGAVIVQDADARKRVPVADVSVTLTYDAETLRATSNSNGFFSLQLPVSVRRGRAITLHFSHRDYKPLELHEYVADRLYIANMVPVT